MSRYRRHHLSQCDLLQAPSRGIAIIAPMLGSRSGGGTQGDRAVPVMIVLLFGYDFD
ncbi:alpha-L-rhamnosidase [Anopheles sinensis]|uniref:Alpha-L-rhamnosidase n=1 Tax=Anopheles sinensis TaxID=74873 RepID=A0A084VAV5_ANOSI|nr:alpha-L-rhamnosidase [Anopheles sinensis]